MTVKYIDLKELYEQGKNISLFLREDLGLKNNNEMIIELSYDLQAGSYIASMEDEATAAKNEEYTAELAGIFRTLGRPTSILEAGVGEATTLSGVLKHVGIAELDGYGFDLSWSRIAYAKEWIKNQKISNVTLCTGSLLNIPFADNAIDIVYTSHSIEPNGGNEEPILKELYRVAKRFLVLLEPGYELASSESRKRMDSHGYCKNLKRICEKLGFKIIEHELFPFIFNPVNPTALTIIKKEMTSAPSNHTLACPKYKTPLIATGEVLFSPAALAVYPIVGGIPCLKIENGIIASSYVIAAQSKRRDNRKFSKITSENPSKQINSQTDFHYPDTGLTLIDEAKSIINMSNIATSAYESSFIPYGQQWIDEEDIQAVVDVLRSDCITTGPKVDEFEKALAEFVGVKEAVAVSSGTAALHAAIDAIDIKKGDEVILSPLTFAATASAIVYQGGTPVFADVEPDTLLLAPDEVTKKVTARTKAIIAVDYAGQPCDYDALKEIAQKYSLGLVADACHSIGATYKGQKVGTLADLTAFSFHPVKHITTGEGGMVLSNNPEYVTHIRRFRNHGMNTDHHRRSRQGSWYYEIERLGYNYRMTDIQCALGISQLRKLMQWIVRRRKIAERYDNAFAKNDNIDSLKVEWFVEHAYHLYVIRVNFEAIGISRQSLFKLLQKEGIGVNVHYIPVYLHPFYQEKFGFMPGLCPVAERSYEQILSLPIFPKMSDREIEKVIRIVMDLTTK
jgi:perosamine synthetase